MEKKLNYSQAYRELQTIVSEIENDDISLDDLSEKVKRASILIRICREKLTSTESEVNEILKEINPED